MPSISKTWHIDTPSEEYIMSERTTRALNMAEQAMHILKERGKNYDNGKIEDHAHTHIMRTLFIGGSGDSFENIVRYKLISHIVDKLCRYQLNGKKDNLLDLANYAFILAAFDEGLKP
jgi:hypothetical protein